MLKFLLYNILFYNISDILLRKIVEQKNWKKKVRKIKID